MDLTPAVAPDRQDLINALTQHDDLGLTDARIVAPGNVGRSVLPVRVAVREVTGQMPPAGTLAVGPAVVQLLIEWIQGLPAPAPER